MFFNCFVNNNLKKSLQINTMPASINHCMENNGYNEIIKLIDSNFIIKKTNEGCLADFIIQPKNTNENNCLAIQLKTTQMAIHNMYGFHLRNKYNDITLICYCIDENKIWIIPYNDISQLKCKINISKKSKYNMYISDNNNINDKLLQLYKSEKLFELEYCLIPINIYQQRELIYREKLESKLFNIKFEYPEIEQCYYDFIINNYKIQEKVCSKRINRNTYTVGLYRSINKNIYKAYKKGMNDFYWIHIDGTDIFYIIPEQILIENNKIEDNIIFKNKPMFDIYIEKNNMWYSKYKYNYTDINLIYNIFY